MATPQATQPGFEFRTISFGIFKQHWTTRKTEPDNKSEKIKNIKTYLPFQVKHSWDTENKLCSKRWILTNKYTHSITRLKLRVIKWQPHQSAMRSYRMWFNAEPKVLTWINFFFVLPKLMKSFCSSIIKTVLKCHTFTVGVCFFSFLITRKLEKTWLPRRKRTWNSASHLQVILQRQYKLHFYTMIKSLKEMTGNALSLEVPTSSFRHWYKNHKCSICL